MKYFYAILTSMAGMGLFWILWHWFKKPEIFAKTLPRLLLVFLSGAFSFLLTSVSVTPYLINFYGLEEIWTHSWIAIFQMPFGIIAGAIFIWSENRKSKRG